MGYSGWTHLDFKQIIDETSADFRVHLEDGKIVWIPKRKVANRRDYGKGDKNGCISVKDEWAEEFLQGI